ncbi:hypothetical protein ACNAW0_02225 [Micromonospora sp. SL1-18]|uniref:hypothetical protein n=1 Tax=Micromonospora sp. SL1-18 TaxID=3399128 RepID=UPI003A4D6433
MDAHRMDEETVERLLAGSIADACGGPKVLVRLFDALRAAPRPHELVGEAAAAQAFRMAHAGSGPEVASHPERALSPRRPVESPPGGLFESTAAVEPEETARRQR